jgi:hypothetical protein
MTKELTPDEIIDALGGTSEVARLCEIQPPSVSEWRRNGIPKAQLKFLRLAHPQIFEELEGGVGNKQSAPQPSDGSEGPLLVEGDGRRREARRKTQDRRQTWGRPDGTSTD